MPPERGFATRKAMHDIMSDAAPEDKAKALADALREAVPLLARASVLVIGDVMLDRWVHGDVQRVSPEAPVPVLGIARELDVPGGAGNVVRNLSAMGTAAAFVSVVGDDQAGSDLTGLIGGQPGVEPWLLVQGGRITTQKTRFVANGQQLLRVDREDCEPVHPKLAERLLRIARDAMAATSVTILSDYRKGVLAGAVGPALVMTARQMGRPIVIDMHGSDFAAYSGADVMVIRWRDLARSAGLQVEGDAAVAHAAAALRRANGLGAIVVVRTGYSLTLVEAAGGGDGLVRHLRNPAPELVDISGAGDTVVAVLAAALASGTALAQAVELANLAGAVAIGRVGTAVVRPRDLLAALSPRPQNKVLDLQPASERVERWRRAGLRSGFAHGAFATLSAHDCAQLERARAACDRLIVAVDLAEAESQDLRAAKIAALPFVDLVILDDAGSASETLRAIRPDLKVEIVPATAADECGPTMEEAQALPDTAIVPV